ncbi:MAG: bifunctional phosphopantothenoylcysteine decarboxylase/phosphopantothenate--cysteine ligase CoaBC [Candidatus Gastranaerophilales bacterium]|nr:bifunctional phosphopantothenoylcysteine decarboxylase/phosphopantothenate--cysteine ligase CoaBC [Candidatus Gastranaerophilales bacterium]
MLNGKKILIGITGAIAAYKICELIRLFKKNGADVKVTVTPNALNFVTKTTLESLSNNPLNIDSFKIEEYKPEHIALTEADVFIIAPASANTIGKITHGICDNLLTSTYCAFKNQVIIAPSMNTNMWENPAVQQNINELKNRGNIIIEPETGFLACGCEGKGRLCDINTIFETVRNYLIPEQFLKDKKIVVTAGGTKEDIDSVRYIGNYSSGKMGIALADSAYRHGAQVVLITCSDTEKKNYNVINVKTALEMQSIVKQEFEDAYSLIMAAAVSDYRVKNKSEQKIKKDGNTLTLELIENPDILKEISTLKRKNQIVTGFCAESENLIENAKIKIEKKHCDFICANDISKKDIGFSSNYNELYIINKEYQIYHIEKTDKKTAADKILEYIYGKNK